MKFLGALALIFFAVIANQGFAGTEGGGGGNAVVCFQKGNSELVEKIKEREGKIPDEVLAKIESIETLDLYQARQPRGLPSVTPSLVPLLPNETENQYINRILARFDRTVPTISDLIRVSRKELSTDKIIMSPAPLKTVFDADELQSFEDSGDCVLATIAVQYSEGDLTYLHIDERLFNHPKNSQLSRNALLLHEYVYLPARKRGQKTSRPTRDLVGVMLTETPVLSVGEVLRIATRLGFTKGVDLDTYLHRLKRMMIYDGFFSPPPGGRVRDAINEFDELHLESKVYVDLEQLLKQMGVSKDQYLPPTYGYWVMEAAWHVFEDLLLNGKVGRVKVHPSRKQSYLLMDCFNRWLAMLYELIGKAEAQVSNSILEKWPSGTLNAELNFNSDPKKRRYARRLLEDDEKELYDAVQRLVGLRIHQYIPAFDLCRNWILGGFASYGPGEFPLGKLKDVKPAAEWEAKWVAQFDSCNGDNDASFAFCGFSRIFPNELISESEWRLLNTLILPNAPRKAVNPDGERELDREMRRYTFWDGETY